MLEGDIFIRSQEIQDGRVVMKSVRVDISEALGGVYHKDLVFTEATEYLPVIGSVVYISNIPGDTVSFMGTLSTLAGFEPGHLVVTFTVVDCAGYFPLAAVSGIPASTSPMHEDC